MEIIAISNDNEKVISEAIYLIKGLMKGGGEPSTSTKSAHTHPSSPKFQGSTHISSSTSKIFSKIDNFTVPPRDHGNFWNSLGSIPPIYFIYGFIFCFIVLHIGLLILNYYLLKKMHKAMNQGDFTELFRNALAISVFLGLTDILCLLCYIERNNDDMHLMTHVPYCLLIVALFLTAIYLRWSSTDFVARSTQYPIAVIFWFGAGISLPMIATDFTKKFILFSIVNGVIGFICLIFLICAVKDLKMKVRLHFDGRKVAIFMLVISIGLMISVFHLTTSNMSPISSIFFRSLTNFTAAATTPTAILAILPKLRHRLIAKIRCQTVSTRKIYHVQYMFH